MSGTRTVTMKLTKKAAVKLSDPMAQAGGG